jgi:hypothetical protein
VTNGTEKSVWTQLSSSFADTIADLENSIVAIDGGGRSTTSGVVWQPGVIVTTHHGLRRRENIQILLAGESLSARWIGSDATTDLAVLGIGSDKLTPVPTANDLVIRTGEVVLSDVPGWEISLPVPESSRVGSAAVYSMLENRRESRAFLGNSGSNRASCSLSMCVEMVWPMIVRKQRSGRFVKCFVQLWIINIKLVVCLIAIGQACLKLAFISEAELTHEVLKLADGVVLWTETTVDHHQMDLSWIVLLS